MFRHYLETAGVQDHLIEGGDVEVQRHQPQALQPHHQLHQLLRPPPREHLQARMALHHRHLDVRGGCSVLDLAAVPKGSVSAGDAVILLVVVAAAAVGGAPIG